MCYICSLPFGEAWPILILPSPEAASTAVTVHLKSNNIQESDWRYFITLLRIFREVNSKCTQLQLSQCHVWGSNRCTSKQRYAVQCLDVTEWDMKDITTREWCIASREMHPIKKPCLWDLKGNLIYIIIMQHSNVLPVSLGFGFFYIFNEERILVFCFYLNYCRSLTAASN